MVKETSEVLVKEFEALIHAFTIGDMGHQLHVFFEAWNTFYSLFESWKDKDTDKIVDSMVAHWI